MQAAQQCLFWKTQALHGKACCLITRAERNADLFSRQGRFPKNKDVTWCNTIFESNNAALSCKEVTWLLEEFQSVLLAGSGSFQPRPLGQPAEARHRTAAQAHGHTDTYTHHTDTWQKRADTQLLCIVACLKDFRALSCREISNHGAHQKCSSSGGAWCDSADKCFLEPWMVRANLSKPCPTSKQEDVRQKCSVARQVLVLPCYSSFDVICHDVKALGWSQCFSLCMLQLAPFDSNFRWLARACSSPWWFSFFYSLRKTLEDRRQIE